MSLSQGDCLGRYEVLGPIGSGGMGEVWRARDTELGRDVAVKVLPQEVASEPRRVERFRREARALAALSHPNLLEIHDVGSSIGLDYVVTELLEGDSLRAAIPPSGLPWQKVAEIGAAAAEGLAAAHERGIVHRDLKPENLFLTADGRIKILDFGLASMDDELEIDGDSPTVTEDGAVLGTTGYIAPEQLRGRPASAQSDIFSLGCVLYELAGGRRAFTGATGIEVMAAILKEEPPQLSSSGSAVPVDLERAVHRCLEKRPEARFQSAADLAFSLKSLGSSQSAPVMAVPSSAIGSRERPRSSLLWTGAIGALIIVCAIFVWRVLAPGGGDSAGAPSTGDLDPNRIAVVPFANRTGDASLDNLAALTADRLTQGLAGLDEIEVAPASVVAATGVGVDPSQLAGAVAAGTRSGMVLTGVWDAVGSTLELQATLEDAALGSVVRAFDPISTDRNRPHDAISTLRDWTLMAVQDHLHPALAWGGSDRFPDSQAYRENRLWFEVMDSTGVDDSGQRANAILLASQHRMRAVEIDPGFVRSRLHMASNIPPNLNIKLQVPAMAFWHPIHDSELTPHQQRLVAMLDARFQGRWEESFRLAESELERNPRDEYQRYQLVFSATFANRAQLVVDEYSKLELDPILPSVVRFSLAERVAESLHRLGRHEEELALVREARSSGRVQTTGGSELSGELKALAALGRTGEIESLIDELLLEQNVGSTDWWEMSNVADELSLHGNDEAAKALAARAFQDFSATIDTDSLSESHCAHCAATGEAGLLVQMGQRQNAYASLIERHDGGVSLHCGAMWESDLAIFAAAAGDVQAARDFLARWLAGRSGTEEPTWRQLAFRAYTQAQIAALLGDRNEAIELLRGSISQGFWDFERMHRDWAFESLRSDPDFQEIVRPKG